MIIQDVLNALTPPEGHSADSVDGLLSGDPGSELRGIAVTFMPTLSAIERAADLKANLIIAHEGLYYAHNPSDEIGTDNPIVREKKKRIDSLGIAVYRCHDYWHRVEPDGVTEGLVKRLGWTTFVRKRLPEATIVDIPPASLREVAYNVKDALGAPFVRVMGNSETFVGKVGVSVGFRGGRSMISLFDGECLDLVVYGEGPEWETPEYVRDALYLGNTKALIVLGHAESERPGMSELARRLMTLFPSIPVHDLMDQPLFEVW